MALYSTSTRIGLPLMPLLNLVVSSDILLAYVIQHKKLITFRLRVEDYLCICLLYTARIAIYLI